MGCQSVLVCVHSTVWLTTIVFRVHFVKCTQMLIICSLTVRIVIFLLYCSVLGMNLFGGKFCWKTADGSTCTCKESIDPTICECDRANFNSLLWSLVTVFQVHQHHVAFCLLFLYDFWCFERIFLSNACIILTGNYQGCLNAIYSLLYIFQQHICIYWNDNSSTHVDDLFTTFYFSPVCF